MDTKTDTRAVPWYRQGWPWIVLLPPAIAVAGGVVTVYLAFSHADPEVCGPSAHDAFAAGGQSAAAARDCSR